MTSRKLTLYHQTRLAVNIIIEDDTRMLTYSILVVTGIFALFWKASRLLVTVVYELSMLATDLKAALLFTGKVLAIGVSALLFGLGVKL